MTEPNQHLPGQAVMCTRRTLDQYFYLAPALGMRELFLYSLGKNATLRGQSVMAAMLEFTHAHTGLLDHTGDRSDLFREHRSTVARARNHALGREGKFWDTERPSDVVLLDEDAAIEKLLYVWLNPVRDGFVERAHHFPGNLILPRHWDKEIVIARPRYYFDPHNNPDFVTVPTCVPPGFEAYPLRDVIHWFQGEIQEREEHFSQKRINSLGSKRVRGRRWCFRVNPLDRKDPAKCKKPPIGERRNPRWASRNADRLEAAEKNRAGFLRTHLVNRRRLKNGNPNVNFPAGTIQARKVYGAPTRAPDQLTLYAAGGWRDPNWTPPNFPRPPC